MEPQVSAVLLAAGSSGRMGRPKQLLPLGDKPFIRHCLDTLLASGLRDITVVIGPQHGKIAQALWGAPVNVVVNEKRDSEMADSVRTGIEALDGSGSAVLVCLSDHPLVSAKTIMSIIEQHRAAPDKIIIPAYRGRRGHPSLFPMFIIEELFTGLTLRDIIRNDPGRVRVIDVDDEGVVLDIDTEEQYQHLLGKIPGGENDR